MGVNDLVRPDFTFDEGDEIGVPVIEKTAGGLRGVEGRELMDHTMRQAVGGKLGRGGGCGGHQHMQPPRGEPFDQAEDRAKFAHAHGMDPDKATFGAGVGDMSGAFGQAIQRAAGFSKTLAGLAHGQGRAKGGQRLIEAIGQG